MPGINLEHRKWHLQPVTEVLTMPCKVISGPLQTVMYVHGTDLPRPLLHTSQKQRGGIGATAVCHRQGQVWRKRSNGALNGLRHNTARQEINPLTQRIECQPRAFVAQNNKTLTPIKFICRV